MELKWPSPWSLSGARAEITCSPVLLLTASHKTRYNPHNEEF